MVFCLFQGEANNQDTIVFLVFYQRTPEKIAATIQNRWSIRMNNHYPLVNIQKAIENGPVEIVDDLPIKNGDVLSIVMLVITRG